MVARAIDLPVERIALEDEPLARDVFADAEGPQPRQHLRGGRQSPDLRQASLGVRALEEMARQHRQAVEQPLANRVRLRQVHLHRVLIDLAHGDRHPADDQQVVLRRADFFVQVNAKREEDIVGVERFAVGETDAAAKRQRETAAIGRNGPRPRQRWLRLLRFTIEVNQVRRRPREDVLRRGVDGDHWIERSRLGAFDHHQLPARAADIGA